MIEGEVGGGPRVLHVARVGFIGGAERIALTILNGLLKNDWNPILACPRGDFPDEARQRSVRYIPCSWNRMRGTFNPLRLLSYAGEVWRAHRQIDVILSANRVDLVHAHHPVMVIYSYLSCRRRRVPLLLHLHEGPPGRFYDLIALKVAARLADRIVCASTAGLELLRLAGSDLNTADVVQNAVDYSFTQVKHEPCKEVSGPGPHIGVFGVLERRKGQNYLINAAPSVLQDFPSAQFWVVGGSQLQDKRAYAQELIDLVQTQNLSAQVHFVGHKRHVEEWMQAMDLIVVPSISNESLSVVLLEALYLGLPVVATDVGGIRDALEHGETGYIVKPRNAGALADAIKTTLNQDDSSTTYVARNHVRSHFAPDRMVRDIILIYEKMMRR